MIKWMRIGTLGLLALYAFSALVLIERNEFNWWIAGFALFALWSVIDFMCELTKALCKKIDEHMNMMLRVAIIQANPQLVKLAEEENEHIS